MQREHLARPQPAVQRQHRSPAPGTRPLRYPHALDQDDRGDE
ncbi:hypothetical protein [Streptomyces sp. NPDC001020]